VFRVNRFAFLCGGQVPFLVQERCDAPNFRHQRAPVIRQSAGNL
jgi:hypothetical protein